MKLYITVEITARELEAKTFLACCAANAGFDVVIGHEDMIRRYAVLSEPGILLDKSIHSEYPPFFALMRRLGFHVAVNDEEGLVFNPKQYSLFNLTDSVAENLDIFFAWGETQRELFVEHLPSMSGHAFSTGNPRIDLLQPRLRPFHQDKVDAIKEKYGDFVLINSRFAFANNAIGGPAYRARLAGGSNGPNIEYLLQRYDYDLELFSEFLAMQDKLCSRYPEQQFVLRPHPSEAMEPWLELAEKHDNLHVVREGNVHQWILASDMLIHNGCATAIEAFYLETPCICYRPISSPVADIPLPNAVSFSVRTFEDLCQCIEGKKSHDISAKRLEWKEILTKFIRSDNTRLAAPAMVDHLLELSSSPRKKEYLFTCQQKINAWIRNWNRLFKMKMGQMLGKKKKVKISPKWTPYSADEFRELVNKFDFYDPGFSQLQVSKPYIDCFRIHKV